MFSNIFNASTNNDDCKNINNSVNTLNSTNMDVVTTVNNYSVNNYSK